MIRDIQLNVDPKDTRYPADDIPKKVLKWIENNKRLVEEERTDIKEGQVVVILEGEYTSMRAVFLRRLPHNLILCSGPSTVNGVPLVIMNQRFVFPVSVFLAVHTSVSVSDEEIKSRDGREFEDALDVPTAGIVESSVQEEVDAAIVAEISKKKGMKTYFTTPFTFSRGHNPLGLNY